MIIITSGIYSITNLVNNHMYIGQSVDIDRRINQHISCLTKNKHYNTYLQNAVNKYGIDNFTFNTIKECDKDDLNFYENFYIKYYNTYENGYNLTEGGEKYPTSYKEIAKKRSDTALKNKKSRKNNKTGYYRVYIVYDNKVKQGFFYRYRAKKYGKWKEINSISIEKLEKKVKKMGFPWKKIT